MGDDKFIQPREGITVVSRGKGPKLRLSDEQLLRARARVQAGESADDVATELAIERFMASQLIPAEQ